MEWWDKLMPGTNFWLSLFLSLLLHKLFFFKLLRLMLNWLDSGLPQSQTNQNWMFGFRLWLLALTLSSGSRLWLLGLQGFILVYFKKKLTNTLKRCANFAVLNHIAYFAKWLQGEQSWKQKLELKLEPKTQCSAPKMVQPFWSPFEQSLILEMEGVTVSTYLAQTGGTAMEEKNLNVVCVFPNMVSVASHRMSSNGGAWMDALTCKKFFHIRFLLLLFRSLNKLFVWPLLCVYPKINASFQAIKERLRPSPLIPHFGFLLSHAKQLTYNQNEGIFGLFHGLELFYL